MLPPPRRRRLHARLSSRALPVNSPKAAAHADPPNSGPNPFLPSGSAPASLPAGLAKASAPLQRSAWLRRRSKTGPARRGPFAPRARLWLQYLTARSLRPGQVCKGLSGRARSAKAILELGSHAGSRQDSQLLPTPRHSEARGRRTRRRRPRPTPAEVHQAQGSVQGGPNAIRARPGRVLRVRARLRRLHRRGLESSVPRQQHSPQARTLAPSQARAADLQTPRNPPLGLVGALPPPDNIPRLFRQRLRILTKTAPLLKAPTAKDRKGPLWPHPKARPQHHHRHRRVPTAQQCGSMFASQSTQTAAATEGEGPRTLSSLRLTPRTTPTTPREEAVGLQEAENAALPWSPAPRGSRFERVHEPIGHSLVALPPDHLRPWLWNIAREASQARLSDPEIASIFATDDDAQLSLKCRWGRRRISSGRERRRSQRMRYCDHIVA